MLLNALMLCFLVSTIQTSSEDDPMTSLFDMVGDLLPSEAEMDSGEVSKEIKKYYKYIANVEQKYYKDIFKKHISAEEKDQVKYFKDILEHLKTMNRDE